MSAQELDSFASAVASVALETSVLTDDVLKIVKQAILDGVPVTETIERVLNQL